MLLLLLLLFVLFFLIKQLFSHETVMVSKLFCFFVCLFVLLHELKLQGNNPQLHYFSPVPKRFTVFFIYFHFNIILHFVLNFTLLFYNSFYYGFILTDFMVQVSYKSAECLRSTLVGFFLSGVHWQWPWTLLKIDPRVLGDVLHSVMIPFLFLFLYNILT